MGVGSDATRGELTVESTDGSASRATPTSPRRATGRSQSTTELASAASRQRGEPRATTRPICPHASVPCCRMRKWQVGEKMACFHRTHLERERNRSKFLHRVSETPAHSCVGVAVDASAQPLIEQHLLIQSRAQLNDDSTLSTEQLPTQHSALSSCARDVLIAHARPLMLANVTVMWYAI